MELSKSDPSHHPRGREKSKIKLGVDLPFTETQKTWVCIFNSYEKYVQEELIYRKQN